MKTYILIALLAAPLGCSKHQSKNENLDESYLKSPPGNTKIVSIKIQPLPKRSNGKPLIVVDNNVLSCLHNRIQINAGKKVNIPDGQLIGFDYEMIFSDEYKISNTGGIMIGQDKVFMGFSYPGDTGFHGSLTIYIEVKGCLSKDDLNYISKIRQKKLPGELKVSDTINDGSSD